MNNVIQINDCKSHEVALHTAKIITLMYEGLDMAHMAGNDSVVEDYQKALEDLSGTAGHALEFAVA